MKRIVVFLSSMMCATCMASEIKHYDVASNCSNESVIVSDGATELCLATSMLKNARIVDASGLMLFWSKNKHLSIKAQTAKDWGNDAIKMSNVPKAIVTGDYSGFDDKNLIEELKKLRAEIVGDGSMISLGETSGKSENIYIVLGDGTSYVFVANKNNDHFFTQISIHGLSREEVINTVVKGVIK